MNDPAVNFAVVEWGICDAVARGAKLVCLLELFRSLYFCQSEDHAQFDLAESVPGLMIEAFGSFVCELGVVIVVSVFECCAVGVYYNMVVVLDADGKLVGMYCKMHIFDDLFYYEKFYFMLGDLGFRTFDTRAGRIGTFVCWDQWFLEGVRLTVL